MKVLPRKRKSLKKKIFAYIFLATILVSAAIFLNIAFFSKNQQIISPVGKKTADSSLEKLLKDHNILFTNTMVLGDSSYLINVQNNGEVRLSGDKNLNEQVSSLQRILRELTIEGKPFKSIDFRFSKPVISF